MGFGGYLAINGHLTFGSLLAFINLLNFVANPLCSLPPAIASIGEAERGGPAHLSDPRPAARTHRRAGRFPPTGQNVPVVRFDRVDFTYGEEPVLQDVSFSMQKGETVAVVGPSGGGKSTVLKLLLGFYPVDHSSVSSCSTTI